MSSGGLVRTLFPPFMFLTALAMVVVAFGLLAFGTPDISVDLHQARATNDELFKETLESDLAYRTWIHYLRIAGLFICAIVSIVVGFVSMKQR
ncbi:MAG: hypothetical protein KDB27_32100 [Planctomycetales bacterium]|nr:hypothetical protein [Planctomycetales bacterium]